ncbi:MAG: R3H domain-containing nucleic acid-binding protein, partial [Candidatus Fimimonas sp.]
LQYLSSLLLNGKNSSFRRVVLDTDGGYRAKREKTLQRLALNLEQKVKRTGKVAKLEPMNPYERRIIHTTLQNSKYVTTESEGQGNARHVVISPKGQSDVLNAPNAPRKTLNFVYRSDKKRR